MKKLFTLLLVACCHLVYSQTYTGPIVTYNFTGNSLAPNLVVGGTALNFDAGNGVSTPSSGAFPDGCDANPAYSQRDWQTLTATAAILGEDFFRFTFIAGDAPVTISSIELKEKASGSGPKNFQVFFDGFAVGNAQSTTSTGNNCGTHNISVLISSTIPPTTEFIVPANGFVVVRIAGYGGTNQAGTWRIDDVALNATVILPIDLSFFRATPQTDRVLLEWQTENEQDNDYMAVERSTDGRNFSEIGRIAGAGTRAVPMSYRFVDEAPRPGTNYYRLRQVDFDGTATYHQVVSVQMEQTTASLYPTLADERVTLDFASLTTEPTALRLYHTSGRLLRQWTVPAGTLSCEVETASLRAGHYYVAFRQGENTKVYRFVKN